LVAFDLDRFAMTRNGKSHKLLLGIWLLFCGLVVGGLMWALMKDVLLAVLLGVAVIPFVWMLSSGWEEADLFRRALRTYVDDRRKRDA
jgi:hypothetical protein